MQSAVEELAPTPQRIHVNRGWTDRSRQLYGVFPYFNRSFPITTRSDNIQISIVPEVTDHSGVYTETRDFHNIPTQTVTVVTKINTSAVILYAEAMLVGLEKTRNQVKIYNVGSEDQTNVKLKLTGSSMAEEAGKATSKTCSGAWAESNPQNGSPNLAANKPSAKTLEKILMEGRSGTKL